MFSPFLGGIAPGMAESWASTWEGVDFRSSEKSTELRYGTDLSLASFPGRQTPVCTYESAGKQPRDTNVALIAITPFDTTPHGQDIYY